MTMTVRMEFVDPEEVYSTERDSSPNNKITLWQKIGAGVAATATFGGGWMVGAGMPGKGDAVPTVAETVATATATPSSETPTAAVPEVTKTQDPMQLSAEEWKTATDIAVEKVLPEMEELRQECAEGNVRCVNVEDSSLYTLIRSEVEDNNPQEDKFNEVTMNAYVTRMLDGGTLVTVHKEDTTYPDNIEKYTDASFYVKDGILGNKENVSYEELEYVLQNDGTRVVEVHASTDKYSYGPDGKYIGSEPYLSGGGYVSVEIGKEGELKEVIPAASSQEDGDPAQQARETLTDALERL